MRICILNGKIFLTKIYDNMDKKWGVGRGVILHTWFPATPLIRGSHIYQMWERHNETAQREEGKKKDGEGGGGLRKPRLRSQILSHSLFTASHVEVLEREREETRTAHEEEGEEEGKQQNDHGNIQNVSAWDSVRS